MSDIFMKLQEVVDEKSFLKFLEFLSKDYNVNQNEWQNAKINHYLEASSDWDTDSIQGLTTYTKPENVWRRCADILYMGKIYE